MLKRSHRCAPVRYIAVVAMAAMLGACSAGGTLSSDQARASLGKQEDYRLGIGDKLKLTVFGEADLSGTFEVGGAGQLSLPLAGEVKVEGMTLAEVRSAVTRRLSDGYLKNPKITVEILTYRPIYVHGEVRSGGEFPFKNGLKLRDAIALAGGYTYRANQGYVLLGRNGQSGDVRVSMPSDVLVMPGDNIRIPERFF